MGIKIKVGVLSTYHDGKCLVNINYYYYFRDDFIEEIGLELDGVSSASDLGIHIRGIACTMV